MDIAGRGARQGVRGAGSVERIRPHGLGYAINLIGALARESEDAVAGLVEENAALRRFLREAGRRLADSRLDAGLVAELQTVELPARSPDLRLSALRDENGRLFEVFVRFQAACEDARDGGYAVDDVPQVAAFLRVVWTAGRDALAQDRGGRGRSEAIWYRYADGSLSVPIVVRLRPVPAAEPWRGCQVKRSWTMARLSWHCLPSSLS
jgi:hypothetical protein